MKALSASQHAVQGKNDENGERGYHADDMRGWEGSHAKK
jgi:hypothetical protein